MCIEPPLPLAQPPTLPNISAMQARLVMPRASAWPWSRYAVTIGSTGVTAWVHPTATASCPMYTWQKPPIFFSW